MLETSLPIVGQLFQLDKAFYLPESLRRLFAPEQLPWSLVGKSMQEAIAESIDQVSLGKRQQSPVHPLAALENAAQIVIEEGVIIEPHVYIVGPCFLAKGSVIRQGAYIRGNCYAGPGSIIGHATEVKDSILLSHAKAAHFAYVGNSIVGHDCNLGAGTKLANFRFDGGTIRIRHNGGKIDTGQRKFGAILGDRSQTGCNSVTNPGTIMMPGTLLGANQSAAGLIGQLPP